MLVSEEYRTSYQSYAFPMVGSGDCKETFERSASAECSHLCTAGRELVVPCWIVQRNQLVCYSH